MRKLLLTFTVLILGLRLIEAKPSEYYWVVESTTCSPGSSTIKIYNDQHELVYTEKVEGRVLDITNKCIVQHLDRKARKLKALKEKSAKVS